MDAFLEEIGNDKISNDYEIKDKQTKTFDGVVQNS